MSVTLKTIFILLFVYYATASKILDDDLLVQTTNGWVLGTKRKSVNLEIPYAVFSGIPYAKPPLGQLRFSAPKPEEPWEGVRDATREGNKCVQSSGGDEDCLYLNVYTPGIKKTALRPVMVYIHGGYFLAGEGSYVNQPSDYLLEEDILIVTMNYRLGIFGFLSTEDESSYGNWGLKDQILALKWVQENIEFFGGDKKSITIFGQSAGSSCVNYLIQSPAANNLFQRAIMQSGTILNVWARIRQPRQLAFALGMYLGIFTDDSKVLVKELKELDAKVLNEKSLLLTLFYLTLINNTKDGLLFAPTAEPEHEGAVITGLNHENLRTGKFNKIPTIVGFVSQEGLGIYQLYDLIRPYLLDFDLFNERIIPVDLNVSNTMKIEAAQEIKKKYFGILPVVAANKELAQFITDDQFVRPIHETAFLMSQYTRVHFYRFSYMGEGQEENGPGTGVSHASDLNYLFAFNNQNLTKSDIITRQRFVRLWSNFAKTSYPTLELELNPDNMTWNSFSEERTYLDIGTNLLVKTNLTKYNINWWKYIFDKYGNPPFDTY